MCGVRYEKVMEVKRITARVRIGFSVALWAWWAEGDGRDIVEHIMRRCLSAGTRFV